MRKIIFDINMDAANIKTSIRFTVEENPLSYDFGTLVFEAERDSEIYKATFSFDINNDTVKINVDLIPSLKSICLITCGIGLFGPVLDCYKKSKKNWEKFKDCLEEQGHTLGTASIACLSACTFD